MLSLSKNRILLLRLFFTNPDKEYYIQEIGRILDKKPGVFQRALYDMEREGIIKSEFKANARYFRANKDYPLYKEYKTIVFKTIGVIGSIKEFLEKTGAIDFSFLYGSFASRKENELSDIDLVIIGTPDEKEILRGFELLENTLRREINYKMYTLADFLKSVRLGDSFLLGILKSHKIMLIGEINEFRKIVEGSPHQKTETGHRTD
jgi:predicted nucleotidyltransferase